MMWLNISTIRKCTGYVLSFFFFYHTNLTYADPLRTSYVQRHEESVMYAAEGSVEAIIHSHLASQVVGRIKQILVKPGDKVKAKQELIRIESTAAHQEEITHTAQAEAARALLELAQKDFKRQQQLFSRHYISQAAIDQAESKLKAAQAQVHAQLSAAAAARTQSNFFTIAAPYDGVITEVPVNIGDTAIPGHIVLGMYEPTRLRVTAAVSQTQALAFDYTRPVRLEFPDLPTSRAWYTATQITTLPTVDTATHTVQIRLDLPVSIKDLVPGMFARVWLPAKSKSNPHLYVPSSAVFRRADIQAVYIIDSKNKAQLRQVKPGRQLGEEIEIMAGVSAHEQVAIDPLTVTVH